MVKLKTKLTFKIFQLITIILINAMSILGCFIAKKNVMLNKVLTIFQFLIIIFFYY